MKFGSSSSWASGARGAVTTRHDQQQPSQPDERALRHAVAASQTSPGFAFDRFLSRRRPPTSPVTSRDAQLAMAAQHDRPRRRRGVLSAQGARRLKAPTARRSGASGLTRFIGRERDLRALRELVREARVVTVLGPPGVGKTRLTLELAARQQTHLARTVVCDLTEARDASGIADAVVRGVGGSSPESGTLEEAVGRLIRGLGPAVVVLDNAEQVAETVGIALGEWLVAAPEARFVITSRTRLGIEGERVWEVAPLSLVSGDEDARPSESVELFIDRARAVRPDFDPRDEELTLVAEIASKLDGLPLALEIAAARSRVLGPAQLLAELENQRSLGSALSGVSSAMSAALDASWARLSPQERRALGACVVFRGGFDLEAFASVSLAGASFEVAVERLQSLRDQSLLYARPAPDRLGELRFGLLLTVRDDATTRTDELELRAAEARHAEHYIVLAERLANACQTRGAAVAMARLETEMENVLVVIRRDLAASSKLSLERAARATLALDELLFHRGPNELRNTLFQTLFAAIDEAAPSRCLGAPLLARAYLGRGRVRQRKGEVARSIEDYERALSIARVEHLVETEALARTCLATHHRMRGELPLAIAENRAALALLGASARSHLAGRIHVNLGGSHRDAGEGGAAREAFEQAVELLALAGDSIQEANARANLGRLLRESGQFEEARAVLEQAEEAFRGQRDVRFRGALLTDLATIDQDQGRYEQALRWIDQAEEALSQVGDRSRLAWLAVQRGLSLQGLDRLDDARACFERAIAAGVGERGTVRGDLARALWGGLEARAGRLGAAERCFEGLGADWPDRAVAHYGDVLFSSKAQMTVLEARRARDTDEARFETMLSDARAVFSRGRARLRGEVASVCAAPADLAFVLEQLRLSLVTAGDRSLDFVSEIPGPPDAKQDRPPIVLAASGKWFRRGAARVSLSRRPALARILRALVSGTLGAGRASVSLAELLSAGWPGERPLPTSGAQRVYTALSTLRKAGLEDALVRVDDGYRLDPAVAIEIVADGEDD